MPGLEHLPLVNQNQQSVMDTPQSLLNIALGTGFPIHTQFHLQGCRGAADSSRIAILKFHIEPHSFLGIGQHRHKCWREQADESKESRLSPACVELFSLGFPQRPYVGIRMIRNGRRDRD